MRLSIDRGYNELNASQYTICDCVLLFQVYFYRRKRREAVEAAASGIAQAQQPSESSPLLTAATDVPPPAQPKPLLPPHWEYPLLLAFVLGSGAVAWYFTGPSDDVSIPEKPGKGSEVELEWKSQTLGWLSAALYIGSRLPQIAHNRWVQNWLKQRGSQMLTTFALQADAMCRSLARHVLLLHLR